MEHVNHPKHYNSHPNGIECIDIIRHYVCDIANAIKYLWRAGLKVPSKQEQCDARIDIAEREEARPIGQTEMGKKDAEKEIEDLKKALWYIEDYVGHFGESAWEVEHIKRMVKKVTGHSVAQITKGYEKNVSEAMKHLLCVGLLTSGAMTRANNWNVRLDSAVKHIRQRIADLEH